MKEEGKRGLRGNPGKRKKKRSLSILIKKRKRRKKGTLKLGGAASVPSRKRGEKLPSAKGEKKEKRDAPHGSRRKRCSRKVSEK